MNQDDIYNLLLLILLMSNEKDNDSANCLSARGSLNELILASLLLNSCNSRNTGDSDTPCNCRDTTF